MAEAARNPADFVIGEHLAAELRRQGLPAEPGQVVEIHLYLTMSGDTQVHHRWKKRDNPAVLNNPRPGPGHTVHDRPTIERRPPDPPVLPEQPQRRRSITSLPYVGSFDDPDHELSEKTKDIVRGRVPIEED